MLRAPEAAIAYARNLFMAEVEEEHRPVVYPVAVTAINHSLANYARSLVTAKRSFTLRRRGSRSTPRVEREEARGGCSPPLPLPPRRGSRQQLYNEKLREGGSDLRQFEDLSRGRVTPSNRITRVRVVPPSLDIASLASR